MSEGNAFTIGVEEEYQIINPKTRELASRSGKLVDTNQHDALHPQGLLYEMHRCQIEIATGICHTLDDVRRELTEARQTAMRAAHYHGLAIAAAGTHPFSRWQNQKITPKDRYRNLDNELQQIIREMVAFGCHVHIGIADREAAVSILNRSRIWLPTLLSLTASEAVETYGDPPESLLAQGIAEDVDSVLQAAYGAGGYEIKNFEITWSEEFAQVMQSIIPLLMGAGMLLLFIEFKTPNFGIMGGLGIALIVIVFLSNYVAGLAGYEAILLFVLGLLLLAVELFLLPGTLIFAFLGIASILVSLVWSLADFWPNQEGFGFVVDWDSLLDAGTMVVLSSAGAFVALILLWKTLPVRWLESKLMMPEQSPNPSAVVMGGAIRSRAGDSLPDQGSTGVVETDLHPIGKVEIDGKYYEASAAVGSIDRGTTIRVVGYRSYSLLVDVVEDDPQDEMEEVS